MAASTALMGANMGLQIADGAMQYYAAKSEAKRQRAFNATMGRLTRRSAEDSFRQGTQDLAIQKIQDLNDTTEAVLNSTIRAAEQRATAKVAAAESGAVGQSVDDLMRNFEAIEMKTKASYRVGQSRRDLARVGMFRQLQTARANQINSTRFQHVQDPNLMAAIIRTSANVLSVMPQGGG